MWIEKASQCHVIEGDCIIASGFTKETSDANLSLVDDLI
jgi:hypothetical protein